MIHSGGYMMARWRHKMHGLRLVPGIKRRLLPTLSPDTMHRLKLPEPHINPRYD